MMSRDDSNFDHFLPEKYTLNHIELKGALNWAELTSFFSLYYSSVLLGISKLFFWESGDYFNGMEAELETDVVITI